MEYDTTVYDCPQTIADVTTRQNITYFNYKANQVNRKIHSNGTHVKIEEGDANVTINGIKYWVGLELVCKKSYKSKTERIYTNYVYEIVNIGDKSFTIKEPCEGTEMTFKFNMLTHFALPYCYTLHSVQGLTINEPITIFDAETSYLDRKYIWTALTRATSLDNVKIFMATENEITRSKNSHINLYFRTKIADYKRQDKKANREIDENEYITAEWLYDQISQNPFCCGHHDHICGVPLEYYLNDTNNTVESNITADRINNDIGHVKTNCRLMCVECNKSKSNK